MKKDKETIDMILNKESSKLSKSRQRACGIVPIVLLLNIAAKHNWQPVLIHYSNSGDTAGDKSRVVGYSAIAFYGDTTSHQTSPNAGHSSLDNGKILLKLARQTIMERLDMKVNDSEAASLESALNDTFFQTERGTFVTLTSNGNLRGCIGNIAPRGTIAESVRRNAINAAFHDPRFRPLTKGEFKNIHIEVSILTDPEPLDYKNSADLVSKLRPNIDGVIIRKDRAGATYLPQVWRQIPAPEMFLSRLCSKAGLSPTTWKTGPLDVYTYQVQCFEE